MRRVWIAAAAAGLTFAGATAALAEKCLQMVVHPVRHTPGEVLEEDRGNGVTAGYEPYEREWKRTPFALERGGAVLSGEFVDNPADAGARRRVAIISHGHTVNRLSSLKYAEIFYRAGFSLALYDQRYFGRSTGAFCTLGQEESLDLAELIRRTRKRFGPDCLIAVHGESMGAATALLCLRYETPDLVVADCPFADSELLFCQWVRNNLRLPPQPALFALETLARLQYGYDIKKTSPIAAVKEADVPICLIHGKADELIECGHSERLRKACRNEKSELHLVDGAIHAHSIVEDHAGYEAILFAFLDRCGAAD